MLMVVSTFFFLLMTLCIKTAGRLEEAHALTLAALANPPVTVGTPTSFGALEAVFLRSLPMALLCLALLARDARLGRVPLGALTPRTTRWLISRGFVGASSMACLFYASLHIPLAMTSLLANTSVFFTGLLAHAFLGERLTPRRLLLVVCGFGSVALVLLGSVESTAASPAFRREAWGYAMALLSGFLSSVAYFSVRKLKDVPSNSIILALAIAGLCIPWLGLLLPGGMVWPRTPTGWTLLLLSSLPAMAGQICMTSALRQGPAGFVSTGQYMGPVFATAVGALFFGETLGALQVLGGLGVICFGVAIPLWRSLPRASDPPPSPSPSSRAPRH
jgi:drug/metabolite transporter (DMT)-like permease